MEFISTNRNGHSKEEWLEKRKHYITGTDAAGILNLSPWSSPLGVWADKKGIAEPIVETEAMAMGLLFEPQILYLYAKKMDCRLEWMDGYDLRTCEKYPRLGASLDGWNHDLGCPVDSKNIGWKSENWGDEFTDEFPEYYKTQLQVQMMVTGAPIAHLSVVFGGQKHCIYQMEYNEELAQKILNAVDVFWPMVEGEEPPEAGADANSENYIKSKFSEGDEKKEKTADIEFAQKVKKYVAAANAEKAAKSEKEKLGNQIKVWMGDATVVPNFCTWKNNKDSETTDWAAVAEELMMQLPLAKKTEIIAKHTTTKPGARQLRITMKG